MFKIFRANKKPEDSEGWYYYCYGRGAHAKAIGDKCIDNPHVYGTVQYDAWMDGFRLRK